MKKIISLVLMMAMVLTSLSAEAGEANSSGKFQYTLKGNGTATIVGYTGDDSSIIVPQMLDGYTVTTIGERAFSDLDYVSLITLPETITAIDAFAFWETSVETINIPDAVEYIGTGAFVNCPTFRISNNHPYYAVIEGSLYDKRKKELLKWKKGSTVPEGIVSIGDYALYRTNEARDIKWPTTITHVGDYAFAELNSRDGRITLPSSVTSIGKSAFENCSIAIDLGQCKFTEIPDRAFWGARNVISLPETITSIGISAFECSSAPASLAKCMEQVTHIGERAFYRASFSTSAHISIRCKSIPPGAFMHSDYRGIEFELMDGVEEIHSGPFDMEEGIVPIVGAFEILHLQEEIYLPASLTYIDVDAFQGAPVTFIVEKGSYAERWASENALPYKINGEEQNLDWLK